MGMKTIFLHSVIFEFEFKFLFQIQQIKSHPTKEIQTNKEINRIDTTTTQDYLRVRMA